MSHVCHYGPHFVYVTMGLICRHMILTARTADQSIDVVMPVHQSQTSGNKQYADWCVTGT